MNVLAKPQLNRSRAMRWALLLVTSIALGFLIHRLQNMSASQLPQFNLQQVANADVAVSPASLTPRPALVNVWASWCVACRTEHDFLMEISTSGEYRLFGLNHRDNRPDALRWLAYFGNPYHFSIFDKDGTLGEAMRAEVLPVTFLIGAKGEVLARHDGPLERESYARKFEPLLQESQESSE
jgi:cytochrome c biogenesis protein CcmG, thiol:disulfide interchange protein DsbE